MTPALMTPALMTPALVLASGSPRRAALLRAAGIPFELGPAPDVDETPPTGPEGQRLEPAAVVRALALRKAEAASPLVPGRTLVAADTLVFLEGAPLGKPRDAREACEMLRALSGRTHEVLTGLALIGPTADGGIRRAVAVARSAVTFRDLSTTEIEAYAATGEPLDKAGAYGIQGGAAAFVARLEGDLDTVIGLSISTLEELLASWGF
jgi:septum formation protein